MPPVPPVPRTSSTRQLPRRREVHPAPSRSVHHAPSRHAAQSPVGSGPDVISSLITSLDVVPRHPPAHLDIPVRSPVASRSYSRSVTSPPRSSSTGSFGVDYGAYSSPPRGDPGEYDDNDLEALPASAPIIRTSKPPSGFSPLTAPKSPREEGGGLRSLLGGSRSASRPSSKGSLTSRDADSHSIGNLSIERGAVPPAPELRRQKSHDSWGRKQGRSSHKGLMYMSSRERLREKEDKKRASTGAVGNDWLSPGPASLRPDPFLAELSISEEPSGSMADAVMAASGFLDPPISPDRRRSTSPRAIPVRDSSLRKSGSSTTKRHSSRRSTLQKTDASAAIPEVEEQTSTPKSRHPPGRKHQESREDHLDVGDTSGGRSHARSGAAAAEPRPRQRTKSPVHDKLDLSDLRGGLDIEDGAPSPAISQGRRKDREMNARRASGQDPMGDGARSKRASNRAKRNSASPGNTTPDPMHVSYERPPSADSIDDAVEAYMCSPRLSQKIRHPQTGRVISFSEVGDSEGSAVFCCVGMGLTRYITAFYDELALTLGLRLITPDRPGVGDSEPYMDGTATPLSWPGKIASYSPRSLVLGT